MPNSLTEREHAHLARELIAACGGPAEVERFASISQGTLSKYSNVGYDNTMPARLINQLEGYCQRRIYSEALAGNVESSPAPTGDLVDVACSMSETVLLLQGLIRKHTADGKLTPREVSEIAVAEARIKPFLGQIEAILRQHDTGAASLRVVGQ